MKPFLKQNFWKIVFTVLAMTVVAWAMLYIHNEHKETTQQDTTSILCDIAPLDTAAINKMDTEIAKNKTARFTMLEANVIPVVFHVIWKQQIEKISDAQLQSQIVALNEAFAGTNSDTTIIPDAFKPLAGKSNIRFVLFKTIYKPTTVTSFSSNGDVCFSSKGGDDKVNGCLNIWVCNKTGAAGFATYPWSGSASTDGIIIKYTYIGTTGTFTNNWSYQKGGTCVHEAGHWLGLIHMNGDAICGSDLVDDTPTQQLPSGSCPKFPHPSSCSPNSSGDLFYDYMDYSNDNCRVMFTKGQIQRMQGYLNSRIGVNL